MSSPDTTQVPEVDKEPGGAQAVTRALAVLACFRDGSPDLGISDIARALELKPSTAHRLVRTLLRAGFLEQDAESSRYRLGNALAEYGQIVYHQRRVHLAEPYLARLSKDVGENAALAVRHGSDALLLSGAQAPWSGPHDVTGMRIPLHASAMGKVLLAWGGDQAVEPAVIGPLTPATDRTITDVDELRHELKRVVDAGYALNDEEMTPGIRTVAVPVFDDRVLAAFALAIRGPVDHLPDERIPALVDRARQTAVLLQAALR
jgi:IclR family transcriptional regulator, acetate operon repressor